jgi:hypothetical protein
MIFCESSGFAAFAFSSAATTGPFRSATGATCSRFASSSTNARNDEDIVIATLLIAVLRHRMGG